VKDHAVLMPLELVCGKNLEVCGDVHYRSPRMLEAVFCFLNYHITVVLGVHCDISKSAYNIS
jgi:hypothetical protein